MPRKIAFFIACCCLAIACFAMAPGSRVALAWWAGGVIANLAGLALLIGHLRDRQSGRG
jgi:hypothetical protein